MSYTEFVRRVLTVFGIGIAILAFWHLRSIFMIAFLSSIIAISLNIPVARLQEYGLKRPYAILVTLTMVFVTLIAFLTWILPVLVGQMVALVDDAPTALDVAVEEYNSWHSRQDRVIRQAIPRLDQENIEETLGLSRAEGEESQPIISATDIANFVFPVLANASNAALALVANLAVVILVSIFLLLDPMDYARGFISIVPPTHRKRALEVMVQLRMAVTAWMAALSLSISVTIFLVWLIIGMIIGIPNALALAVIAGLATIIPNLGSIIPVIPLTIFTLASEPSKLPFVLIAYFSIQQFEGNVITPFFVKRQLNIPTGALFLFQIASATIFGFLGVLLAVPLLAVVITLIRELYVHDVLKMEGYEVQIEATDDGNLKLVTAEMKPVTTYVKVRVFDKDDEEPIIYASPD